jgi:16S rRNA (guanine(966)-N(2))-methyltransferase RsmD
MRIISGTRKHYKLGFPPNVKLRPTSDFCKEAIFNIMALYFDFEEMEVLDLFAGSGGISFEFASRGARKITAIDNDYNCVNYIRSEASNMNFANFNCSKQDALKFLHYTNEKYNLIFADPPYNYKYYNKIWEIVFERDIIKPKGWLMLEHSKLNSFSTHPDFLECRKYGDTFISIFNKKQ